MCLINTANPVAGSADGTGSEAQFSSPLGVAVDAAGSVYVADTANSTIRKVTSAGVVSTVAGTPPPQPGNVNGTGSEARGSTTRWVSPSDNDGNLYVADTDNHTIRKITAAGVVSTLAGQAGVSGYANGTGSGAHFSFPTGLTLDKAGNIYIADNGNAVIRKITPAGVVTTVAGIAGFPGNVDGDVNTARFYYVSDMVVDSGGNLFVLDSASVSTIRKVSTNGLVTTFAGHQVGTFGGYADGVGTNAGVPSSPFGMTIDAADNLYVADFYNNSIRKVTPDAVVTTIAPVSGIDIAADSGDQSLCGSAIGHLQARAERHPTGSSAPLQGPPVSAAARMARASRRGSTVPRASPWTMPAMCLCRTRATTSSAGEFFAQFGPANPVAYAPSAMDASLKVSPSRHPRRTASGISRGNRAGTIAAIRFPTWSREIIPWISGICRAGWRIRHH